jgi:hypothetical protein
MLRASGVHVMLILDSPQTTEVAAPKRRRRFGFVKRRSDKEDHPRRRYRVRIVAKLIVLSAQMSNPIPAAAQGGIHGHRTQTATFHATITQPDIGTSGHGCIPLTELGAIGDRYNVTRNSHRVLTSLKRASKPARWMTLRLFARSCRQAPFGFKCLFSHRDAVANINGGEH